MAEKEMYKNRLEEKLSRINVPDPVQHCRDVKSRCLEHCDLVDQLAIEVLETVKVIEAAQAFFEKKSIFVP